MAKSIYVGNISFNSSEDTIKDLFTPFGEVTSVHFITDRETGRFRGFGFVEMDENGVDAAIEALNGKEVDGRALRVNVAQERKPRSPRY